MRIPRCYCQQIESESVLDPFESSHLCRVLRAQNGSLVELFDGKGTLACGSVIDNSKKKTVIAVDHIEQSLPRQSKRIILAVSLAKGQRFDWLIEKCTELGADHIGVVQFEHTVKLGKASVLDRYQKIAITAANQSRRLHLPQITGPAKFDPTLETLMSQYPDCDLVFGDPQGEPLERCITADGDRDRIIVIGPEAGLSETELQRMNERGASGVLINKNILRIETAAIAFCAVLAANRI